MPPHTSTFCVGSSGGAHTDCNGWVIEKDRIYSGTDIGDSVKNILQLDFVLVRPGSVNFTLMVDSEVNYDGLYILINNQAWIIPEKVRSQNSWWHSNPNINKVIYQLPNYTPLTIPRH
jgi:hypothetical protein